MLPSFLCFVSRRSFWARWLVLCWSASIGVSLRGSDYHFIGIYQSQTPGRSYWTQDRQLEESPLNSRAEYSERQKAFAAARKGQSPTSYLLTPDRASLVFEFQTFLDGFKGEFRGIGVIHGKDVEQAHELLAKRVAEKSKYHLTPPKVIFTWRGDGGFKQVITRNYSGVQITFTAVRSASGSTTVHAQGKNTHREFAALVGFTLNGGTSGAPLRLEPGAGFNQPLGSVDTFDVQVGIVDPAEKGADLWGAVKEVVLEQMSAKDGKLKLNDRGVGGARG